MIDAQSGLRIDRLRLRLRGLSPERARALALELPAALADQLRAEIARGEPIAANPNLITARRGEHARELAARAAASVARGIAPSTRTASDKNGGRR